MFMKALVVRVVGALQQMWLLNPDAKVPHLCSEVVILIEILCPPLLVRCSSCPLLDPKFGFRSLEQTVSSFRAV